MTQKITASFIVDGKDHVLDPGKSKTPTDFYTDVHLLGHLDGSGMILVDGKDAYEFTEKAPEIAWWFYKYVTQDEFPAQSVAAVCNYYGILQGHDLMRLPMMGVKDLPNTRVYPSPTALADAHLESMNASSHIHNSVDKAKLTSGLLRDAEATAAGGQVVFWGPDNDEIPDGGTTYFEPWVTKIPFS